MELAGGGFHDSPWKSVCFSRTACPISGVAEVQATLMTKRTLKSPGAASCHPLDLLLKDKKLTGQTSGREQLPAEQFSPWKGQATTFPEDFVFLSKCRSPSAFCNRTT